MKHPMRLEPTREVIYKAFCLYLVQGRMNGAPNENLEGLLIILANDYTT